LLFTNLYSHLCSEIGCELSEQAAEVLLTYQVSPELLSSPVKLILFFFVVGCCIFYSTATVDLKKKSRMVQAGSF